MVILVIAYAFFLCIVKGRNWWRDRMGYDPLERWKKRDNRDEKGISVLKKI
jgi:hypothetical protein